LDCEAPASLLISQKTGIIIIANAKRHRGAAVQSQAKAPDIKIINTRDKFLTNSFLSTSWTRWENLALKSKKRYYLTEPQRTQG
jgi:hypothetical protein